MSSVPNDSDRKHVIQRINKIVNQTVPMNNKTLPTDATHCYEHVDARIIQIGATVKKL
jgi:hypothetical protein